jgi:uncharacterized membrane protein YeiH
MVPMVPLVWSLVADLLGTFFFALSGSLLAARRGFDIIGSLLLGLLTGLGGGIVRDVILGRYPTAFADPRYFAPPLAAALLVFFLRPAVERLQNATLVADAGGLTVFCITGTLTALQWGATEVSAALLGVATAIGGGLMRDVVANQVPAVFNPRDLYAVPAVIGAASIAALWPFDLVNLWTALGVAIVVFGLRILSLRFHWHVPLAAVKADAESDQP